MSPDPVRPRDSSQPGLTHHRTRREICDCAVPLIAGSRAARLGDLDHVAPTFEHAGASGSLIPSGGFDVRACHCVASRYI